MPIYEYQCQDCHELLEVMQKVSDAPLRDCPKCGRPALKKKISAAAFRLKGSGWYETDFKTGNRKNVVGGEGGGDAPAADSKSGDAKAGEARPAESKGGDSKPGESKSGGSSNDSKKSA